MIQRIQTVWLLLAFVVLVVAAIVEPMSYFKGLVGGMAVVAVGIVFLFKNRPMQANLCTVLMALGIIYYIALAIMQPVIEWYCALPMVAVVFLFLARKAIVKDEKLVKSLDRIR